MSEENEELENEDLGGNAPEQENALGMSDEDIMNMAEPPGAEPAPEPSAGDGEGDGVLLEADDGQRAEGAEGDGKQAAPEGDPTGGDPEGDNKHITPGEDPMSAEGDEPAADAGKPEKKPKEKADSADPDDSGKPAETDSKVELAKLFAPFKANGRQMQVSSVDDALTLMKMGANYNKKMHGMKPGLRVLKMLENNDLLDEEKINGLIDLSKKKPEAIAHLMKESGIDPLNIDTSSEEEYKPETYTVNDQEVELDSVLDDIRATPQFKDTMDIIGNKWDQASRQELYDDPTVIKIINEHVGGGLFPQIMNIVDNERALGRLNDLSDIAAYKHVGDILKSNGAFDASVNPAPAPAAPTNEQPAPTPARREVDPKLKSRKRAAAAPRGVPGSKPAEYNPLSLSDEEFAKVSGSQFM